MTIFHALLLGIIEGLTEFLPISSTAHMLIASDLFKIPSSDFLKTFTISIQLGAILAVVILYWKRVWYNLNIIWRLAAAFVPTAIIGLIFYKIVKNYLMESLLLIAISLIVGGIIIFFFENWYAKKNNGKHEVIDKNVSSNIAENTNLNPGLSSISDLNFDLNKITYKQAIILGLTQAIAIIPGVSRSGATIIGGLAQGIKRQTIVEFSFLLAIPTMIAATALDIYKNPSFFSGNELVLWLIGFITSFITAIIGIKFLIKYIQKNDFKGFAWYRMVLGVIILGVWLLR